MIIRGIKIIIINVQKQKLQYYIQQEMESRSDNKEISNWKKMQMMWYLLSEGNNSLVVIKICNISS